jgi:Leucine-rich repeat (LRR) protein
LCELFASLVEKSQQSLTFSFNFCIIIDLANNKLKKIEGVGALTKLRKIDLGANRIRVMDEKELGGLVNLEELWLGKNKIEEIGGLEKVSNTGRLV